MTSPASGSTFRAARRRAGRLPRARWSASTVDEALLVRALTHRSYAYEHGGLPNNERLEFLGDSVLGLVVTEHALPRRTRTCPRASWPSCARPWSTCAPSPRSPGRSGSASTSSSASGEEATGGRDKASILADTMEALIGTVHLSGGHRHRRRVFVHHLFDPLMTAVGDPRGRPGLEDQPPGARRRPRARHARVPRRRVRDRTTRRSSWPARSSATRSSGHGTGRSKKEAEQRAAEQAWAALDQRRRPSPALEPKVT